MSIERRIEKAERAVGIQAKPVTVPGVIFLLDCDDDAAVPHFPEPVTEWLTQRKTIEKSERLFVPYILFPNPFAEYEARHGLEPGTLANHPLHGKLPFSELLASVPQTKGEQPCTTD